MSWPLPLASKEPAAPPNDAKLLDLMKGADARRLFKLEQLEVNWDEQAGALWTFMRPRGRPSYNLDLLEDFHAWQRGIVGDVRRAPERTAAICCSARARPACSISAATCITSSPRSTRATGRRWSTTANPACASCTGTWTTLGLPMITIGLAQGDALGGGFESLLSFNVIIAERGAKFGFPETMFGLFPGMGAYSLVARRVGRRLRRGDDADRPHLQRRRNERGRPGAHGGRAGAGDRSGARLHADATSAGTSARARSTRPATWSIRSRSRSSTASCRSGPMPACNCATATSR